jgi:hypothetical protein
MVERRLSMLSALAVRSNSRCVALEGDVRHAEGLLARENRALLQEAVRVFIAAYAKAP